MQALSITNLLSNMTIYKTRSVYSIQTYSKYFVRAIIDHKAYYPCQSVSNASQRLQLWPFDNAYKKILCITFLIVYSFFMVPILQIIKTFKSYHWGNNMASNLFEKDTTIL